MPARSQAQRELLCEECREPIVTPTKRGRTRRFCSKSCSGKWAGRIYGKSTVGRKTRMVSATERRCRTCGEVKLLQEFYSFVRRDRESRTDRRYYFSDCKPCQAERSRLDRYGTTLGMLIENQGSDVCPLCLIRKADSVDHDHATGEVRGAICRKCNLILHYMDDVEWRKRAEAYVAG